MRIAVTGNTGQVVTSLLERGTLAGHEIVAIGRPTLDLADVRSVSLALDSVKPDVVVAAAAYTAVDRAEGERATAFAVNATGAGAVAAAAKALDVPVIHISTDYVFDGQLDRPYVENDPVGPTGVYGNSKLEGERAVLTAHENSAVLRVAWVYSPFGGNFVKTMLRLSGERDEVPVVADQIGNPTSALAIADGVIKVAANLLGDSDPAIRGVFHMTAPGEASWADFAEAIFAGSALRGGPSARVRRIGTIDYPTPAMRPVNSRLNSTRIARFHRVTLPEWHLSLEDTLDRLLAAAN